MANIELPDNFVKIKEMTDIFSELEAIRTNVILRIKLGKDEEEMRKHAGREASRLRNVGRNLNHACPPGKIWDDELQRCVPI